MNEVSITYRETPDDEDPQRKYETEYFLVDDNTLDKVLTLLQESE